MPYVVRPDLGRYYEFENIKNAEFHAQLFGGTIYKDEYDAEEALAVAALEHKATDPYDGLPDEFETSEFLELTGLSQGYASSKLGKLVAAGVLTKVGHGLYRKRVAA